jgi:hypothetical protein
MVHSFNRGHEIIFIDDSWVYKDNGLELYDRECKRCGKYPTKDGYDACVGKIDGAKSACCGHGVEKPYVIY